MNTSNPNLLYSHYQYGPYEQYLGLAVDDQGNGLPIEIACREGDPPGACSHHMSVANAEMYARHLNNAIKVAKKAGLG